MLLQVCTQCSTHWQKSEFSKHRKRMCKHCFAFQNTGTAKAGSERVREQIEKDDHS